MSSSAVRLQHVAISRAPGASTAASPAPFASEAAPEPSSSPEPPAAVIPPYVIRSLDGRPFMRLTLGQMWQWRPIGTTILSGDSFRVSCPFVCDSDYGVGEAHGCRFQPSELTPLSRVYVKLEHWDTALSVFAQAPPQTTYVTVHGGGDTALSFVQLAALQRDARYRAIFAINIPPDVVDGRLVAIPLGVERSISPRGMYPAMYLHQRTGYNLAAKLCWAPFLAADVASMKVRDGYARFPLLYMNYNSATNSGVRDAARRAFGGKSWVVDHVNAGSDVQLVLPHGISELAMETTLQALWRSRAGLARAPWFSAECGTFPHMPQGIDPAFVAESTLPGYPVYLKHMATVPFVLAPEGNGISTHRAWEILYAGGMPVVRRVSPIMDAQFAGLPVLLVGEWAEVTPELLCCFALELLARSLGVFESYGPGALADSELTRSLLEGWLGEEGRESAQLCAGPIADFARRSPATHPGYVSLDSLDYAWWESLISRVTLQLANGTTIGEGLGGGA
jgi:hypothetical protein